jgi:murein DD-endopeptidase MepM/ murein hydrolase activator NlpD
MNIILFTTARGRARTLNLSQPRYFLSTLLAFLMLNALMAYAGYRIGVGEPVIQSDWQAELQVQKRLVSEARRDAQTHLNALAVRMGQLQAQMLRLNALGQRLSRQANLNEGEFDFDQPPAMGGPHDSEEKVPAQPSDFVSSLDELARQIEDREQKLTILETLLMNRNLRERVMPARRPTTSGWLSSSYGKRTDPFTGNTEFHKGIDFAGKAGAEVIAAGEGIVTWAGKRSAYGNMIEISHGDGYVTRYGHNKKNLVGVGDTVKKGQVIALMGSTGRSTGPHVHFEVRRYGKTVNPERYIQAAR